MNLKMDILITHSREAPATILQGASELGRLVLQSVGVGRSENELLHVTLESDLELVMDAVEASRATVMVFA